MSTSKDEVPAKNFSTTTSNNATSKQGPISKTLSTPNLFSILGQQRSTIGTSNITGSRQSLDFESSFGEELHLTQSPVLTEHAGEHGLGLSGLRRIRQQPQIHRENGSVTAPASRSASLSLSSNVTRNPASPISAVEDLSRFPSESLHSFSFAHQSEESMHTRQNVLRRSMDFMRDKLGWAASNPGLVAAQARLTGDHEVQSMLDLLARAQLIGETSHQAHGLGAPAPLTGPAEVSGNVFDQSFAGGSSGNSNQLTVPVQMSNNNVSQVVDTLSRKAAEASIEIEGEVTLDSLSKSVADDPIERATAPQRPRALLKRTLTNTDEMQLQQHLTDTLARPYTIKEDSAGELDPISTKLSNIPSLKITPSMIGIPGNMTPASAAPHGHGNRSAPVSQAIFTTEAHSPWTITAANDLACLVFGVTGAEVRKLGILEVVRPERRKWLEDKLRDPEAGSSRRVSNYIHKPRISPSPSANMNVGSGITARLLSKPPSRMTNAAAKRRAQTDDGVGASFRSGSKSKNGAHKSRGVLLCGDVVPIQKRNGKFGSASLWVKEKKAGLIWVLEEIAEDVAYINVDEVGCVTGISGAAEQIWGQSRIPQGMDIKRLVPAIPRTAGTNTGMLDLQSILDTRYYTARTSKDLSIPVTVQMMENNSVFQVSSFPHIAGIMVLNSQSLSVLSSNTVFSGALFGQSQPEDVHINEIIPSFDQILNIISDEDNVKLVDGIVVPEHSFRRARALLAIRDGTSDAAAVFARPSGVPARHRDGSEILVDIQMRVVKSERSTIDEDVIEEAEEESAGVAATSLPASEVVYALWITYSRHLHAMYRPEAALPLQPSRAPSPCLQPIPDPSKVGDITSLNGKNGLNIIHQTVSQPADPDTQQDETFVGQVSAESTVKENGQAKKKTVDDFVVLEDMGQGAYGQVKLVRYKAAPGSKMVIKYVTKKRILVDTWTRDRKLGTVPLEIHVLDYLRRDDLRHPNIVEMADFFEDDTNYYIEMIPHGLPGMDLFDYIELRTDMTEKEGRNIFVQVAQAVWHLHIKAKVVHRDIKDENVILDGDGNIKLIDFGSAAYIKNGPFDVFVGTIDYAAPEVLSGMAYRGKEQDVWALGILLYTIVYKENPFYSIDEICDHDLRIPYVMSEASIDLIRLMLNRDVDQRISIGEVLDHPWCKGVGADNDLAS